MVEQRVRRSPGQTERLDVVGPLTVFLVVLVGVPSRLVFEPLGSAGTPAQIIGVVLAVWWLTMAVSAQRKIRFRRSGIRIAMLVFAATVLLSYVGATTRPIDGGELRSADLGVLSVVSWIGILFVTMDHIPTCGRLEVLLRRVVLAGAAMATLGVAQFVFKQPFTNYIQIPGLTEDNALTSVLGRGGFARPSGTALHPIEFGAVLTMILPLALHFALFDRARPLVRRWYPVAAISIAVPISISRSAIVSAAVVLCVLVPTWAPSLRRRAYMAIPALLVAIFLFIPGLLGTLTGLFTGIFSDDSALSRTGSYGLAWQFISRSPAIGRGLFTFLPSYRILDNQYLLSLIELGIIGTAALLALFWTAVATSARARTRLTGSADRDLANALTASVASAAVSFALFDAFSFPMVPSLLFLLIGCIGVASRLAPSVAPGALADSVVDAV